MIPQLRAAFNQSWTEAQFKDLIRRLETRTGAPLGFPISETPCFFPQSLMTSIATTGLDLVRPDPRRRRSHEGCRRLVPVRFRGPGAEAIPTFLQVDFGLVRDADGTIAPKLVELQAFASLYAFQLAVAEAYRDAFRAAVHPGSFSTISTQRAITS